MHAGQTVSPEDLRKLLWGGEAFADFDRGWNSCIRTDPLRSRRRPCHAAKNRYVMISPQLLEILRAWWRVQRPERWLFPGDVPSQHLCGIKSQGFETRHASRAEYRPLLLVLSASGHDLSLANILHRAFNLSAPLQSMICSSMRMVGKLHLRQRASGALFLQEEVV